MARLREERNASFRRGMQDSRAADAMADTEARRIINGRITEEGNCATRRGSIRTAAVPLNAGAPIYGATRFVLQNGAVRWLVIAGAQAYLSEDEGKTGTAIAGAGALSLGFWTFTTIQLGATNFLYAANGGANVCRFDGTTWSAMAAWPAGVRFLAAFNDRLWGAGHNGNHVIASKIVNPAVLDLAEGALDIQVQAQDGDSRIMALCVSPNGERLMVHQRNSVALLNGYGEASLYLRAGNKALSRSVGCMGHRTLIYVGDDGVSWLSERGIEYYSEGAGLLLATPSLRGFFKEIAWSSIVANSGQPAAVYLPTVQEGWYTLSAAGTQNDYLVCVNFGLSLEEGGYAATIWRYAAPTGHTLYVDELGYLQYESSSARSLVRLEAGYQALADGSKAGVYVTIDEGGYLQTVTNPSDHATLFGADRGDENSAPMAGGYDGHLRQLDVGGKDDVLSSGSGGQTFAMLLLTRPFLFEDEYARKKASEIDVSAIADAGAVITAAVVADGMHGGEVPLNIPASADDTPRLQRAKPLGHEGRTLQVEIRTTDQVEIASVGLTANVRRRVS